MDRTFVSADESGATVLEWWSGDRKVTMYPKSGVLLKVWGPTFDEMQELSAWDAFMVTHAFQWLYEKSEQHCVIDAKAA